MRGTVHDHTEGNDDTRKAHKIYGKPEDFHSQESEQNWKWDGERYDEGSFEISKEKENDNDCHDNSADAWFYNCGKRAFDHVAVIADYAESKRSVCLRFYFT